MGLNDAMSTDSEDDSFEIITETIGVQSASETDDLDEESIPSEDVKIENEEDVPQIEDYCEEEENIERPKPCAKPAETETEAEPQTLRERIRNFMIEIGTEDLQNMFVVLHSLLADGLDIPAAVRLAVETSDAASAHPLVQDMLPLLTAFAPKFQPWVPVLTAAFNPEQIVQMIPNLMECITQAAEGQEHVNLDIASVFPAEVIQNIEALMPNGVEREFVCDPEEPMNVIEDAREAIEEEFGPVHYGVICDGCGMDPIVGVRYKSTQRGNYDLCAACEPSHDPADPLIKIKLPLGGRLAAPGIWEFQRAIGGRPGCRGCRRGRGGRGRGFRGRRCPFPNGFPMCPMMRQMCEENNDNNSNAEPNSAPQFFPPCKMMKKMFRECKKRQQAEPSAPEAQEQPFLPCEMMKKMFKECKRRQQEAREPSAPQAEEPSQPQCPRELKEKIKVLKKEAKLCRKELKMKKKEQKQVKKELKKAHKRNKQRFASEVVAHLDTPEKHTALPGTSCLKTWKVKNVGTAVWSEETLACCM